MLFLNDAYTFLGGYTTSVRFMQISTDTQRVQGSKQCQRSDIQFTLVDYLDTTEEELDQCQHTPGPSCRCTVCMKLKLLEDRFILKSGSFYSQGLNTRDEVKSKTRVQWK